MNAISSMTPYVSHIQNFSKKPLVKDIFIIFVNCISPFVFAAFIGSIGLTSDWFERRREGIKSRIENDERKKKIDAIEKEADKFSNKDVIIINLQKDIREVREEINLKEMREAAIKTNNYVGNTIAGCIGFSIGICANVFFSPPLAALITYQTTMIAWNMAQKDSERCNREFLERHEKIFLESNEFASKTQAFEYAKKQKEKVK